MEIDSVKLVRLTNVEFLENLKNILKEPKRKTIHWLIFHSFIFFLIEKDELLLLFQRAQIGFAFSI